MKDGRVAEKEMVYECPFCAGKVESNVRTGRLDHRNVCGNQFYVKNGNINNATRQHAHTCPQCLAVVCALRVKFECSTMPHREAGAHATAGQQCQRLNSLEKMSKDVWQRPKKRPKAYWISCRHWCQVKLNTLKMATSK